MWNYNALKQAAAENGVRVGELLALAPANDPFYTGRPSELAASQWFANLWAEFGYGHGVHLRRIHYQIVSQDPPLKMPNGRTYENTLKCWNYLNNAAKWARYLDAVPGESFVDRRNPEAIIYRHFYKPDDWDYQDPTPGINVQDTEDWEYYRVPEIPELPTLPTDLPEPPSLQVSGYYGIQQPYLVEVWAEKTTMNDVLLPLCEQYSVNLVTGAGELSITAVISFLDRVAESGLPARILYVSDFDPAGMGMPISVARKIEYYLRKGSYNLDIALEPIVLTSDQVQAYNLPRVPVKDSDRRKANWQRDYGKGQTELDALEALHPGELHNIVEQAILNYFDPTLPQRSRKTRRSLDWYLWDVRDDILNDNAREMDILKTQYAKIQEDYSATRARFAEITAALQEELDTYIARMESLRNDGEDLYSKLYAELNDVEVDLSEYPLPDPDLPAEADDLLYDSIRSYARQLTYYKAHRHNAKQIVQEA